MLSWETAVCREDQTGWGGSMTKAGLRRAFPLLQLLLGFLSVISSAGAEFTLSHSSPSNADYLLGKRLRSPDNLEPGVSWEILKWSCIENHVQNEQIMGPLGHLGREEPLRPIHKETWIHPWERQSLSCFCDLWVGSRISAKASRNWDPEFRVRVFIVGYRICICLKVSWSSWNALNGKDCSTFTAGLLAQFLIHRRWLRACIPAQS